MYRAHRLTAASFLAIPFILVGMVVYAQWVNPGVNPPADNLAGPVWFQPLISTTPQSSGQINIDGPVTSGTSIVGTTSIPGAHAVEGTATGATGIAVYGAATGSGGMGVYGAGLGDPSLGAAGTSWAGYFNGYVAATQFCTINPGPPVTYTCGGTSGNNLWTAQTGTGNTNNIYKTTLAGITGVGTNAPNLLGFQTGTTVPAGVKFAVVGNSGEFGVVGNDKGPRIYISNNTDNPEIDWSTSTTVGSTTTESHWGVYADASGATPTGQLRFWSGTSASGTDKFSLDANGVMTFYGWSPIGYSLNVSKAGVGGGTITSGVPADGLINCGTTCAQAYGSGSSVQLTATPDSNSAFNGWSGGATGGTNPVSVTMSSAKTVTATFVPKGAPTVTTLAATDTSPADATKKIINGEVYANGYSTSSWLIYGKGSDYASSNCAQINQNGGTKILPLTFTGGTNPPYAAMTATLSALPTNTTVYYCATANNSVAGNVYGTVMSFTTPPVGAPSITSLTPSSGLVGASVTIAGSNFGTTQGTSTVSFNGTAATPSAWSDTSITAPVPINATSGYVVVTVVGRANTNSANNNFTVQAPTAPVLNSPTVASITSSGATLGATITSDGGATITARGTCWDTSANPAINCLPDVSTATGLFTQARTGMSPGTLYHYRGYATNSAGTGYAADATFTTSAAPTVPVVGSPTSGSITSNSAILGATVSSDGGASVTSRGVCWSLSANPAIGSGTCVTIGSGTGIFSQNITGLPSSSTIHYRGYATNSAGTGYTADATFTTLAAAAVPVLTSIVPSAGLTGDIGDAITINGAGLSNVISVNFSKAGSSPSLMTVYSVISTATTVNFLLDIDNNAGTPWNVTVTTAGGTSNALSFRVNPG